MVKAVNFEFFQRTIIFNLLVDKSGEIFHHGVRVIGGEDRLPGFCLYPSSHFDFSLCGERPGRFDDTRAFWGHGRVFVRNGMNNLVVRGDSMPCYVRKKRRADDRFIVEVSNVSDNDLKNGVFMGGFGDSLMEAGRDTKEMFDI